MSQTVTPQRERGSKGGMNLFGWLLFLGMVILLIPLLPVYIALKLYDLIRSDRDDSR